MKGSFRDFVRELETNMQLLRMRKGVSKNLELAAVMKAKEGTPILAPEVGGAKFAAVGNVFATRELVARYLGCGVDEITKRLMDAINRPSKPKPAKTSPALETAVSSLDELPIPFHTEKDGGPYICSGIVVAKDPEYGTNCSFHRMMQLDGERMVLRILPRHLDAFIERAGGELDVAVIIGAPINVLLASAISTNIGTNELEIANSLAPFETVRLSNGIEVPSEVEFIFEARITKELANEGPFVDLTDTYDIVRRQHVMEVKKIHARKDALFHVLLPGGMEHKVLMGMPREPTIFNEVSKVAECKGVSITPGGCSWLHGVVSIHKKNEDDGKKAIEAAFRGHASMKHVVVVDDDVDIHKMEEVEWAIATRFQGDRGLVIKPHEKGSSLDPSANPETRETTKVGVDATAPLKNRAAFDRAKYKKVNAKDYL
ncbi:MAG: UbiD family decarboxylase [Candidatus ainarchaeum sp.]|nr:UbiD family decarboxylase [Candidatus ainarchaeum sp.]